MERGTREDGHEPPLSDVTGVANKPLLPQPVGRQREVLYLPAGGHTVVLGTAGSGKTTMAMHRAVHLADQSAPHGGKTLLLSFNNALLRYFESFANLDGANIEVRTFHHFARGYLNTRGRMSWGAICGPDERLALVEKAVGELRLEHPGESVLAKPVAFLTEEVKWLAQHGISSSADYAEAERTGRHGARLPRKDRTIVYAMYERYREVRAASGKHYDWDDLAITVLEEASGDDRARMYRHIVIDEGQDFSPMMLQSLAALAPKNGSLTFFGDMAQQIYGNKMSWRSAGLTVSKVWEFKENYRNTRQVAALALAIAKMRYFAATPDLVSPNAPTADGPRPALVTCSAPSAELAFTARQAKQLSNAGSVAILLRTREEEDDFARCLPSGSTKLHRDMRQWRHGPGVFYGTYASAKGLEFDAVILPRLDGNAFPTPDDVETFGPEDAATIAGHQLYVGVTRARATLILTHSGTLTPLLPTTTGLYDRSTA